VVVVAHRRCWGRTFPGLARGERLGRDGVVTYLGCCDVALVLAGRGQNDGRTRQLVVVERKNRRGMRWEEFRTDGISTQSRDVGVLTNLEQIL